MPPPVHRQLARYLLAVTFAALALGTELAFEPVFSRVPFLLFAFAVGFATCIGGRGPGWLALGLSAVLGNVFFHEPIGKVSFGVLSVISTGSFLVLGTIIVVLIGRYRVLVSALRRDRDRRVLFADASAELDRSLDFETTVSCLSRLAVPRIADWCGVDLIVDGKLDRKSTTNRDPQKLALLREMLERYPPGDNIGVGRVLATGERVYRERVTDADLQRRAVDAEHLAMLRRIGIRSYICMPMKRAGKLIGVISIAVGQGRARYRPADVEVLAVLADRAAIAIERAELYSEAKRQRARAEQASRTKDEFIAILSHELRNPLAPITTALELMAEQAPTTFQRERTVIERQVRQLSRLVDDLLDVTRIVRGTIELHRTPLDLRDVVTHAVETTSPLIEERGHVLTVDVQPRLYVFGDEARLVQAVANLLSNAAKYTEPGGRIDVAAAREDGSIVLRVRDTGAGIAPDMLPQIFDPFVQEPQSLDRTRGGLGLGLAIVRNIIQLHDGQVSAASEGIGKGSVLTMRLPPLDETAHAVPEPRREPEPPHLRPVLVVDDNRDALDLLADGLERRGVPTVRAYDGPSALAAAADAHPHVALLDIGLPVMDGYELARRLHELDQDMQLIAVTGYGQPADAARAKEAGFVAHLVKPVTLDQIHSTVKRFEA